MSYLVYDDDNRQQFNGGIRISEMNPINGYLKHYANYLYLNFIATKTDNPVEKRQAVKELGIAERKMRFWQRHPNWDARRAATAVEQLKKDWRV